MLVNFYQNKWFLLSLQTTIESDSDSSDCSEPEIINFTPLNKSNKQTPSVADLLRSSLLQQQNMTSFESMTAQLATIASLNGLSPIYPGNSHFFRLSRKSITTTIVFNHYKKYLFFIYLAG